MNTQSARQRQREIFVKRRLWADFEATCPTKAACGVYQLPASCGDCGWNSRQSFDEAEAAADKLERKEAE